MALSTFSFNNIEKEYLVLERDWTLPAWAPIEREFLQVPGRPGGIQSEMRTGLRRFPLPIIIRSRNLIDKKQFVEDMAAWLIHKEAKPLVFSKYPNRKLYAYIEGTPDFAQLWNFGQGTLNIVCEDPYEYGPKKVKDFSAGVANFRNEGTIDVPPFIRATVTKDITHLQLYDDKRYFQIGESVGINTVVKKREERLLNEAMNTLVGWSNSGLTVDGGTVAGSMETNGYSFGAASYGIGTAWHGPAIKKSVPQAPLTDFKIRVKLVFKNPSVTARGRIEIYLLDEQSVDFGKFAMKRTGGGSYGNSIEARAGGTSDWNYFANFAGVRGVEWRDFEGILEFSRVGDLWTMHTAMVDPVTKKHHTRATFTHRDIQRKYMRNLAQIQLHIAQSGTTQPMTARISGLEVFRINPITGEETNVIASEGDEFELDFKTKRIYLNGDLRPDLKAFGSNFFSLPPGDHALVMDPEGSFTAQLEWEEGYK